MTKLRFLFAFWASFVAVNLRRLSSPPLRPSWTIRYEAFTRALRNAFAYAQELDVPARRAYLDASALPSRAEREVTITQVITGGVPAMWVAPKGATAGAARPTLVYFHGGGYEHGSCHTRGDLLARVGVASKVRSLVVDYRLAPDHPYPAALDDALAVVRWLRENGNKDLVFAGDGAGANLALATMLRLRELGEALPLRAALVSAWFDMSSEGIAANYDVDTIPRGVPATWLRAYVPVGNKGGTPVSGLQADLRGLPPMLLQVGDAEVFRDDVLSFAKKARAEGVNVTLTVYKDMTNFWHASAAIGVVEAQRAIGELAEFLGQPLSAVPGSIAPPRPRPTV